jgi:hypothetical protein
MINFYCNVECYCRSSDTVTYTLAWFDPKFYLGPTVRTEVYSQSCREFEKEKKCWRVVSNLLTAINLAKFDEGIYYAKGTTI